MNMMIAVVCLCVCKREWINEWVSAVCVGECMTLQLLCSRDCVCVCVCVWPLEDHTLALLHPGVGSHQFRVQKRIFTHTTLDPLHQPAKNHTHRQCVWYTTFKSVCVCVCVDGTHLLSDSDGRFLSVDCQLILKAFHFSPHLRNV